MTQRTLEQEAELKAAADYVKVYTRPTHIPTGDEVPFDSGCFSCRHVKPNMSPGSYTTIFGMIVGSTPEGLPQVQRAFGMVISFDDKAWAQSNSVFARLDRGAYNAFPQLPNSYRLVEDVISATEDPYVRLVSIGDGPTQHVNKRLSGKELMGAVPYEPKNDLILIAQPKWGVNMYIDPSTPLGERKLELGDMRFRIKEGQTEFAERWTQTGRLDLTPVKGKKKSRRPRSGT